jgi:hypothetical protein
VFQPVSQAVLNTLLEYDFLDAFKKMEEAWKGTTSKVMVVSRSAVSFVQMATPVPRIMDTC